MGNSKHDWLQLENDFITGQKDTLEEFFRPFGIPTNTWVKHTSGWKESRIKFRRQAIELANQSKLKKQARMMERQSNYGRVLQVKAGRAFIRRDLTDQKKVSVKELADIIEKGAKIEREAIAGTELQRIPGGLAFGVEIEGVDSKTIRIMAKTIADSKDTV